MHSFTERKAQNRGPTADELIEQRQRDADAMFRAKRDAEQEKAASKHKKKHKRDQSLLDLHQKKLKKKKNVSNFHTLIFTLYRLSSTCVFSLSSSLFLFVLMCVCFCRRNVRKRRPAGNLNDGHSVARKISRSIDSMMHVRRRL